MAGRKGGRGEREEEGDEGRRRKEGIRKKSRVGSGKKRFSNLEQLLEVRAASG